jgi:hypothetical protein
MWGDTFRVGHSQKKHPLGSQVVQAPLGASYTQNTSRVFSLYSKRDFPQSKGPSAIHMQTFSHSKEPIGTTAWGREGAP